MNLRETVLASGAALLLALVPGRAAEPSSLAGPAPAPPLVASSSAPAPSPATVSATSTLGGKSKGKSVTPRPRRPSTWARFRSLFRGRRATPTPSSNHSPLANPLQGMHPNRMDAAVTSGAVPRRTAATGGGGYSGLTPAHGQAPFTVTTGQHPVAGAGRNGALAATRPRVPASPSAPALPKTPVMSHVVSSRPAQAIFQAIPPGLQRREPVGVRAPHLPARRGKQASTEDGNVANDADPARTPSASHVVYSKLPTPAEGAAGGGEPMPNRRLTLRSWGQELDADASLLTGGTGIVVGDPAKGYTPIMAPPIPLPIPPPVPPAANGPKARPYIQPIPPSPPGYQGGPGRVRPYILPVPPPLRGAAGAAPVGGSAAPPNVAAPQQHPIAKYFF